MEIKIRNVNFLYGMDQTVTDANLFYDLTDDGFYLNGSIKVSIDEYNANATNFPALIETIKTKLKDKIATY